jgi:glucose/arabinose dehydrogenase
MTDRLMSALVALLLAVPVALMSAGPADAATSITWSRRASGLTQPVQVVSARDGTDRLFVVEKPGRVRIYRNGVLRSRPYLDIRARVRDAGEGGLLSIAFHPQWKTHPYFWVTFVTNSGDLRVSRFRASTYRAGSVDPASGRAVLTVPHPDQNTNHFAGQLAFGRTGLLFVSTGDGGGSGDPGNRAQNRASLQGKILRLRVVGAQSICGRRYCVPSSNPFAGSRPGRGEVWALGLRNAWRFSVDARTGHLWIGDVGQNRREEVDRIKMGVGGRNLGWSCYEGRLVFNASRCRSGVNYHEPRFTYGGGRGESITGGFVYRGRAYAGLLGGRYVAGDFVSGRIFHSSSRGLVTAGRLNGVTSFGEGANRELWATTIGGGLYRMVARST